MKPSEYWIECIAVAAEECGAVLTDEQRTHFAQVVQGAHEEYGMAFYQPESPVPGEVRRLETELKVERSKIGCSKCGGRGRLQYQSGPWWCNTQCDDCGGEGKRIP